MAPAGRRPDYEPDDGPLTDEQLDQLRALAKNDLPTGRVTTKESLFDPEVTEFFDRAKNVAQAMDAGTYESPEQELVKKKSILSGLDSMWDRAKKLVVKDSEAEHAPIMPVDHDEESADLRQKLLERAWKDQNPSGTLKQQRDLYDAGRIKMLPWEEPEFRQQVLKEIPLQADNDPGNAAGQVRGFGNRFPGMAVKGDMFLRTDTLPSALYKFNGKTWIEIDKNLSDTYAYDGAYIDYLIEKIASGEYDPELLSDSEREQIEQRLNNHTAT